MNVNKDVAVRLAEEWEQSARSAFVTASQYADGSMERRFCEHGAMVNFNCASALREALASSLPES